MQAVMRFLGLFPAAFASFREDRAARLGAALAYYTVLSIPPLLVVLVAIAGMVFDPGEVRQRLVATFARLVGGPGAAAVNEMMATAHQTGRGVIATAVGVTMLLLSASGVFGQLKDALNTLWEVQPRPGRGLRSFLGKYVFSMMVLLGTGFLLIVSLAVTALLAALGDYLARSLPGGEGLWHAINFVLSLGVVAVLFALLFRFIPDGRVVWKDALVGGLVTSVLFTVGQAAIGFYLGRSNVGSSYGAAGSLVVILVWIYYSSMIFLYGAEFTKTYAVRLGERVRPDPDAMPVTREARAQQGMPARP
jgi:membrane protein